MPIAASESHLLMWKSLLFSALESRELLSLVVVTLLILAVLQWLSAPCPPTRPPGPSTSAWLPFLTGKVPEKGDQPLHCWLDSLSHIYGPVMTLDTGRGAVVVVSRETIRKELCHQADLFSKTSWINWLSSSEHLHTSSLPWSSPSVYKDITAILSQFIQADLLEECVASSLDVVIARIRSLNNAPFDPEPLMTRLAFDVTSSLFFGRRLSSDKYQQFLRAHRRLNDLVEEQVSRQLAECGDTNLQTFSEMSALYKQLHSVMAEELDILQKNVYGRKTRAVLGKMLAGKYEPNDTDGLTACINSHMAQADCHMGQTNFISVLHNAYAEPNSWDSAQCNQDTTQRDGKIDLTSRHTAQPDWKEAQRPLPGHLCTLTRATVDIFRDWLDRCSCVLGWALWYLSHQHPLLQLCQQEIDTKLEGHAPGVADKAQLTYTEAMLLEVIRSQPCRPLAAPCVTTGPVTLGGFELEAGKVVTVNEWSVSRDSSACSTPCDFTVHRHLQPLAWRPEVTLWTDCCAMDQLLKLELLLLVSSLLHNFTFHLPPPPSPPPAHSGSSAQHAAPSGVCIPGNPETGQDPRTLVNVSDRGHAPRPGQPVTWGSPQREPSSPYRTTARSDQADTDLTEAAPFFCDPVCCAVCPQAPLCRLPANGVPASCCKLVTTTSSQCSVTCAQCCCGAAPGRNSLLPASQSCSAGSVNYLDNEGVRVSAPPTAVRGWAAGQTRTAATFTCDVSATARLSTADGSPQEHHQSTFNHLSPSAVTASRPASAVPPRPHFQPSAFPLHAQSAATARSWSAASGHGPLTAGHGPWHGRLCVEHRAHCQMPPTDRSKPGTVGHVEDIDRHHQQCQNDIRQTNPQRGQHKANLVNLFRGLNHTNAHKGHSEVSCTTSHSGQNDVSQADPHTGSPKLLPSLSPTSLTVGGGSSGSSVRGQSGSGSFPTPNQRRATLTRGSIWSRPPAFQMVMSAKPRDQGRRRRDWRSGTVRGDGQSGVKGRHFGVSSYMHVTDGQTEGSTPLSTSAHSPPPASLWRRRAPSPSLASPPSWLSLSSLPLAAIADSARRRHDVITDRPEGEEDDDDDVEKGDDGDEWSDDDDDDSAGDELGSCDLSMRPLHS